MDVTRSVVASDVINDVTATPVIISALNKWLKPEKSAIEGLM
jgi:hypothetical protein